VEYLFRHLAVLERQHDLIGPAWEAGESLRMRTLAFDPVAILVDQRQIHGSLLFLQLARLKIEPTCIAVQAPPRAVTTPRALSERAIPRLTRQKFAPRRNQLSIDCTALAE
jgi:hypothetical protein